MQRLEKLSMTLHGRANSNAHIEALAQLLRYVAPQNGMRARSLGLDLLNSLQEISGRARLIACSCAHQL
jgi:hypothetical protein